MLPKIDHAHQLDRVSSEISESLHGNEPLRLVASIESGKALMNIGEISSWKSEHSQLSALLVRPSTESIVLV